MNLTFILFRINQNKPLKTLANVGAFSVVKNQPFKQLVSKYVHKTYILLINNKLSMIHICHEYALDLHK